MALRDTAAPPGWLVNPSGRDQRAPIVALGLAALVIALDATAQARGLVSQLFWEPLPIVTHGGWVLPPPPIPMPELDVLCLLLVVLTSLVGGGDRWRSRPHWAMATGAAVALAAVVSVTRLSTQYVTSGKVSTLFFLSAAAAVAMLPLAADETYAALVHERRVRRGAPRAAYCGPFGGTLGNRAWDCYGYVAGTAGIVLGFWLLIAPVDGASMAARSMQMVGGLVVAIGALALAQVARPVRWVNAAIGIALVFAPLVSRYSLAGAINAVVVGLALAATSSMSEPVSRRKHAASLP